MNGYQKDVVCIKVDIPTSHANEVYTCTFSLHNYVTMESYP